MARLETGHTPSRKKPEYWGGDIPWIGIKDVTANHGRVLEDTLEHTNESGIANSSARVLPANTVCLSRTASVGYVVVMGRPMATSQDFVNWVCSDALDYRFLKYVLLAERTSFLRFASGTTHQTIYFPEVKAFHVCMPSVAEQRRIVAILGTLDDKIELNRRMSETLEEMARALFKAWFVDFVGVDDLVDSNLGQVPRGWPVVPLASIAEAMIGGDWGKDKHEEGHVAVRCLRGVDLHQLRTTGWSDAPIRFVKSTSVDKREPSESDVIVEGSGHCGRSLQYSDLLGSVYGHPVLYSNFCKRFRLQSTAQAAYVEHLLNEMVSTGEMKAFVTGTAMPNLDYKGLLAGKLIVVPPADLLENWASFSRLGRRRLLSGENQKLSRLRDTLLPKLISGELRVPDAERLVSDVS